MKNIVQKNFRGNRRVGRSKRRLLYGVGVERDKKLGTRLKRMIEICEIMLLTTILLLMKQSMGFP